MLILGLPRGVHIQIGDNVKIYYTGPAQEGDGVRIGIEAPIEIPIIRSNAICKTDEKRLATKDDRNRREVAREKRRG